jgi:hypothetical protein
MHISGISRSRPLNEGDWWALITTVLFGTQRAVFMQSFLFGWVFLALMFLDPSILNTLLNAVASTSHPLPASSYTPAPAVAAL